MLSRVGCLNEFEFFIGSGAKNGNTIDATGIRQIAKDDTDNAMNTAKREGSAPKNAFPLSVDLQYIYCDARFIPVVSKKAIIGIPIHNIIVKNGMTSLK